MTRVLLCGAFGQGNPGDDGLLDAFLGALAGHDVVVTSAGPVPEPARAVRPHRRAVGRALRDVDAVVVGGGTVFKSLHPAAERHHAGLLAQLAALRTATAVRGQSLALVGVGAGELRGRLARRLASWTADRADLLILRDEESAAVLTEAGASGPFRVAADATWPLLDLRTAPEGPVTEDRVLVVLSHVADRDPARLVHRLCVVVGRLVERGHAVSLQPWQDGAGDGDLRLGRQVLHELDPGAPVSLIDPPPTLPAAQATAAAHRAVVTLRFHGLVAAAAAGRPTLAFAHEPKLGGLARRLGQPAVPSHAPPAVLTHAVDALLDTAAPDRAVVAREAEAARRANALLRLVVSAGAEDDVVDRAALDLTSGVPW